jgi:chromosome segregation ATPase
MATTEDRIVVESADEDVQPQPARPPHRELKDIHDAARSAGARLQELHDEWAGLQADLEQADERYIATLGKLEQAERERDGSRIEADAARARADALQQRAEDTERRTRDALAKAARAHDEAVERIKAEHAAELTKRAQESDAIQLSSASLRDELEAARTRIGEAETSWQAMRDEVRKLDEQLSASQTQAAEARSAAAELRTSLRDALADAAAASERADEASARVTATEERLEIVRRETAALKVAHGASLGRIE